MQKATLKIAGMSCNHCKMSVEKALKELDGVAEAVVNLEEGTAQVTYDLGKVTTDQFQRAVEDAGYQLVELY
ncbi:MAG: heavy-metal-associated domain-containing protein [Firmicutes bacterium]|nr:heavy-metal-associated domain-containing protein [Bacillota bacterium]